MNILFLHLSDAHIKNLRDLNFINVDAMINSLSQVNNFDECVLVFSGDVVQSGKEDEYRFAGKLIGNILKSINVRYFAGKKHIHTLIVPGNHDNLSKNPSRNHDDLKKYYVDKKTEEHFLEDLDELSNFYKFAAKNNSFKEDKILEVKIITFGDFVLRVNLINSAPFSVLGSDNGDKGLHYLPKSSLNKLSVTEGENYTISIIHHSPEWFSDESKKSLYNKINDYTDLLFVGHEHFSLNEHKIVNGRPLDISTGLALHGTITEHGFNILILNVEEGTLFGQKFTYNGKIYSPTDYPIIQNDKIIFRNKYNFTHTYNYMEYLRSDEGQWKKNSYLDYFVFPTLELLGINSGINVLSVSTEENFYYVLRKQKKLMIEGSRKSGKSILAKYLCLKLSKNFVPLLLHEEDFVQKNNDKIIRLALENQYGAMADYNEFMQLRAENLVLILDCYDDISRSRWELFFNQYSERFGYLILFCSPNWNIEIKENAIDDLLENKLFHLRILPFYYDKRQELIKKIYDNFHKNNIHSGESDDVVRNINDDIASEIKHFHLNPDFIHQYVIYYLQFSFLKTQTDNNVFSKVFEANITFRLAQNTSTDDVNEILVALDFVAHKIHFSKRYTLSIDDFKKAVEEYNIQYDNNLNPKKVYNVAKLANIIQEPNENFGVEFCSESTLAYFTALHLNRLFNEGKGQQELKYILDNACFKINGDIILFLSYITSNVQILRPIKDSLIKLMKDWEEFDIDKNNISFLNKTSINVKKTLLPDETDRREHLDKKTQIEKDIIENEKNDNRELYSYDESKSDSFSNKLFKALKYLELASKILPSFRHILGREEKSELISILYTHPNKLIYFALNYMDKNFESIVNDILIRYPTTKQGLIITSSMVEKSLQNQAIIFIFCIYDFIAYTASTNKGLNELNKFNFNQKENYMLQNLMMEENNGSINNFMMKLNRLFDSTDKNAIKQMILFTVRKFFLNHDVEIKGEIQRVVDKFFDSNQKKTLKLIQAKNRSIKR